MRRVFRVLGITAAAVVAAAAVFAALTLPPAALEGSGGTGDQRLVWGAYHVHSTRSDGSGTPDEIAAAAAAAGLHFVIFTDHGDGTAIDPPTYRHGVLCIEGVEISTTSGHVVALGVSKPSDYPLAGEARDVIEDVHRLGGVAIAAHPDSPRPALRWRGQGSPDVDGFEWLNVDSVWRSHSTARLLATGLRAVFRAPESIGSLFETWPAMLERWDRSVRPGVFSLAALDAHARIGADSDGRTPGAALRLPGYRALFRTVATAVPLDRQLSGQPAADAALVLDAIRNRRSYTIIRAFADVLAPLAFGTRFTDGGASSSQTSVQATVSASPGRLDLDLLRDGVVVISSAGELNVPIEGPARYRVRARIPGTPFPWIVSDALDLRDARGPAPATQVPQSSGRLPVGVADSIPGIDWRIEKNSTSIATVAASDQRVVLTYRLGDGVPSGQYAALSVPAGADAVEAVEFTGSARRPMRVSLQIRVAGGADGLRWGRSIYLDPGPRPIVVNLSELQPIDRQTSLRPISARVQSILVVVDTLNAKPGSDGEVTLTDFRVRRAR